MTEVRNKARQERLRAALRENLKRRKQQAKGRTGGPEAETTEREMRPGEDRDEPAGPPKDAPERPD